MQTLSQFKRGDTFKFYATLQDSNGAALTGKTTYLKSQIRDNNDNLVADLAITEPLSNGQYLFQVTTSTESWPLNTLYLDIQMAENSVTVTSETIVIPVVKDVTR